MLFYYNFYDLQGWQSKWMRAKSWKIFRKPRRFLWNATFQVRSCARTPIAFTPPLPLSSALSNTLQCSTILKHKNIDTQTTYIKAFHAPPYITHKAVLQKLSLLLSEIKLVGFFMYLTLFTKPKSILEFSVAKALRSLWWTEGLPVIGGEITTNLVRSS